MYMVIQHLSFELVTNLSWSSYAHRFMARLTTVRAPLCFFPVRPSMGSNYFGLKLALWVFKKVWDVYEIFRACVCVHASRFYFQVLWFELSIKENTPNMFLKFILFARAQIMQEVAVKSRHGNFIKMSFIYN